jgi:hypothetical protein
MVSSSTGLDAIKRLAAIAGMLGSEHDGERANAARLASLELKRLGVTWRQVIERAFTLVKPAPGYRREEASQPFWQGGNQRQYSRPAPYATEKNGVALWDVITMADENRELLNDWECKFIDSFLNVGRGKGASPNQWVIIEQIAAKIGF